MYKANPGQRSQMQALTPVGPVRVDAFCGRGNTASTTTPSSVEVEMELGQRVCQTNPTTFNSISLEDQGGRSGSVAPSNTPKYKTDLNYDY